MIAPIPPKPARIQFTPYYEGFWGGTVFRFLDWAKIRLLVRLVKEQRPPLIVDIGCGSGGIGGMLRNRYPDAPVVGFDHELRLLMTTYQRGIAAVLADFDRGLPLRDGSVPFAYMADSIEHAEDPGAMFDEVVRILAPGGTFVVFTPPYDSVTWVAAEKVHGVLTRRPADHIAPFTRESLVHSLSKRFRVGRVGYLNAGLTMFGIANRH